MQSSSLPSRSWVAPGAIALLHFLLGILAFYPAPTTGADDSIYVSLARSLIERGDYTSISDPVLPPHTVYPPVFPAVVAAGLYLGLSPEFGLRIIAMLISSAAVFVSTWWMARSSRWGPALAAGLFLAVSPELIRLSQLVLSDGLFWLLSIGAIALWGRAAASIERQSAISDKMPAGLVVAASALTVAAHFTRSAGAPLIVACVVWLAMLRQKRAIAILVGLAAPLILLWAYRSHLAEASSYLAFFRVVDPYDPSRGTLGAAGLVERFGNNVQRYTSWHLPRLALGSPLAGALFGGTLAVAVLAGWAMRLRQASLAEIWFPIYVALVLMWPEVWAGPRFLLALSPLIALYAAESVGVILRRGTYPRLYGVAATAALLLAVAPQTRASMRYAAACRNQATSGVQFPCVDQRTSDFLQSATSARGKLPAGSVVLTRKPSLFFHYSGYASQNYPMSHDRDELFGVAQRLGADYVLADQLTDLAARYLNPVLEAHRESFCVIPELSTTTTTFLRIDRASAATPAFGRDSSFRICDAEARVAGM